MKNPNELTDSEKLAICIAAGCQIKTETNLSEGKIIMETVNPVSITLVDGEYRVSEMKGRQE